MFATVTVGDSEIGVSGASTPLSFFAPAPGTSAAATVKLYMSTIYHGSFPTNARPSVPNATATLALTNDASSNLSWSVVSDPHSIITAYQSLNPYLITVQRGANYAASLAGSPYQEEGYLKTNDALWWHPAEDMDEDGAILGYHIQISADASFSTLLVDVSNHVPTLARVSDSPPWLYGCELQNLEGSTGLQWQAPYYWRIRAEDNTHAWSDWITRAFSFGITPPEFGSFFTDETNSWRFAWDGESTNYVLEFAQDISSTNWQAVTGPMTNTDHIADVAAPAEGFYRILAP